uniref:Tyrosine-protein kinase n=1 Tax=Macrostomum lignano TaxID=282301 RepID=A0A1I8IIT8_9PLAT
MSNGPGLWALWSAAFNSQQLLAYRTGYTIPCPAKDGEFGLMTIYRTKKTLAKQRVTAQCNWKRSYRKVLQLIRDHKQLGNTQPFTFDGTERRSDSRRLACSALQKQAALQAKRGGRSTRPSAANQQAASELSQSIQDIMRSVPLESGPLQSAKKRLVKQVASVDEPSVAGSRPDTSASRRNTVELSRTSASTTAGQRKSLPSTAEQPKLVSNLRLSQEMGNRHSKSSTKKPKNRKKRKSEGQQISASQSVPNLSTVEEPSRSEPAVRNSGSQDDLLHNGSVHVQQPQLPPPRLPPKMPEKSRKQMKALFDFEKQTEGDLSFKKDDVFDLVDDTDQFWWKMTHTGTGETGYVPYNYVQQYDGGPTSLSCWFDLDRREAERNLLMPGLQEGTFLLRPCRQRADQALYTLSIRTEENTQNKGRQIAVKHYMVKPLDSGGLYISPKITFPTVKELLEHYEHTQDGLCSKLTKPCPRKYEPPPQFRDLELNRNQLQLVEKIGQGSFGEVWKAKLGRLVEAMPPSQPEFQAQRQQQYQAPLPPASQQQPVVLQKPPSQAPAIAPRQKQMRALFSFEKQVEGDLSFRKDDILDLVDNSDEFWWKMRHTETGETGYVPYNYVQPYDGSPTSMACWFDVDRREAERNLLMPGLQEGTFLLRPCRQKADQAVYTFEKEEQTRNEGRQIFVKHYMVKPTDQNGFYISPKKIFASMQNLVRHYQNAEDGLCCRLTMPCQRKYVPPPQFRDFELNRNQLTLIEKLGRLEGKTRSVS